MAQWVKDLALSLLWHEFDPWTENFQKPWVCPKQFCVDCELRILFLEKYLSNINQEQSHFGHVKT